MEGTKETVKENAERLQEYKALMFNAIEMTKQTGKERRVTICRESMETPQIRTGKGREIERGRCIDMFLDMHTHPPQRPPSIVEEYFSPEDIYTTVVVSQSEYVCLGHIDPQNKKPRLRCYRINRKSPIREQLIDDYHKLKRSRKGSPEYKDAYHKLALLSFKIHEGESELMTPVIDETES